MRRMSKQQLLIFTDERGRWKGEYSWQKLYSTLEKLRFTYRARCHAFWLDVSLLVVSCSAPCNRRKLERVLYRRYYDFDLSRYNGSRMHPEGMRRVMSRARSLLSTSAATSRLEGSLEGAATGPET